MEINVDKLTRLEIINHAGTSEHLHFGRVFSAHEMLNDFKKLTFSVQDGGKTLKIFLDGEAEECEHEWISLKNEVIEDGEMCKKCYKLKK